MNNCVCGFNPPSDPNPDCERCQLICHAARLEKERDEARELARCLVGRLRVHGSDTVSDFEWL